MLLICVSYELLVDRDLSDINGEIFNVSYENKKIIELAEIVAKNVKNFLITIRLKLK